MSYQEQVEWIDISEFKIGYEISSKPLHFKKTFAEQKASLKEGEEIASYELLQKLRNSGKYPDSFTEFWVNVLNPDKISESKSYVARFNANSVRAILYCDRNPSYSYATLGVFVVRRKK